ncbi:MAG: Rieske (2Fe-2S) protein [Lentisphaerae bacterium]|nr:Rieske (2Fe-2S) protein [Lentisphaerota bacterium]
MGLTKVAELWEIFPDQMKAVKLGKNDILIANVDGKYYAMGNVCTHRKGDLSKGTLAGKVVTCPNHKATFDITTGKVLSGPKVPFMHPTIENEPIYALTIRADGIYIEG